MERGVQALVVGAAPAEQPVRVALRLLRTRRQDGAREGQEPGVAAGRVVAVRQQDVPAVEEPGAIARAKQVDCKTRLANRDRSRHRMELDLY